MKGVTGKRVKVGLRDSSVGKEGTGEADVFLYYCIIFILEKERKEAFFYQKIY